MTEVQNFTKMRVIPILNYLLKIILFFYNKSAVPRNIVGLMIRMFKFFIIDVIFEELKSDLIIACGESYRDRINAVFAEYEFIFDYVDSEKK